MEEHGLADGGKDLTVNLSMERVVAYSLLFLTVAFMYAKIQSDLNYLKDRADKADQRFDKMEQRLWQTAGWPDRQPSMGAKPPAISP